MFLIRIFIISTAYYSDTIKGEIGRTCGTYGEG